MVVLPSEGGKLVKRLKAVCDQGLLETGSGCRRLTGKGDGGLVLGIDRAGGEKAVDILVHDGPPEALIDECLSASDSGVAG